MNQFVVMGVSGCGKSSVAALLAQKTGGVFLDADDFHPAPNKAKMAAAIPLSDEDRWPWLDVLNAEFKRRDAAGETVFFACSALRQVYRDRLASSIPGLRFIFLQGTKELIHSRMTTRENHFMPTALLDSQFATLEEPADALVAQISDPLDVIVEKLLPAVASVCDRRIF